MADVWFAQNQTTTDATQHAAATSANATATASADHATTAATSTATSILGVSAGDLLAHPGDNLLASSSTSTHTEVVATAAVVPADVHVATVDHTQLLDDQHKNTPLI